MYLLTAIVALAIILLLIVMLTGWPPGSAVHPGFALLLMPLAAIMWPIFYDPEDHDHG